MRLLVTGAGGMLGVDVVRAARRAGHEPLPLTRADLDVADAEAVQAAVQRAVRGVVQEDGVAGVAREDGVQAIFNCAAWTDVDGAETHASEAHAVNATGAGNLARAAAQVGIPLVHVSTDYVFDGRAPLDGAGRPRAYLESDPTGPRSVYGQSKLAGELLVLEASPRHLVARTSWLFGTGGPNFVATMLRLAGEREAVRVVTDQTGCPTWTGHLAPALIGLIERELQGLVHLAGSGSATWHELAREIFRQAELDCRVEPCTSAELARPAPRPAWSAMESQRRDVLPMPDWRDGLAGYLAARAGMIRP